MEWRQVDRQHEIVLWSFVPVCVRLSLSLSLTLSVCVFGNWEARSPDTSWLCVTEFLWMILAWRRVVPQ